MALISFLKDAMSSVPMCKNHHSVNATHTCAGCLLPICDVCSVSDGSTTRCPACVKSRRRWRAILGAVAAVLAAFAGVLFVRYVGLPWKSAGPAPVDTRSPLEQG